MVTTPLPYRADVNAALTMCWVLYTLAFGAVVSKPVAAHWAQGVLGEPWAALIGRALVGEKTVRICHSTMTYTKRCA